MVSVFRSLLDYMMCGLPGYGLKDAEVLKFIGLGLCRCGLGLKLEPSNLAPGSDPGL